MLTVLIAFSICNVRSQVTLTYGSGTLTNNANPLAGTGGLLGSADCTFLGSGAGLVNNGGKENIFIGGRAGYSNTSFASNF